MEKTWMPVAAGILCIVAGGLSLIGSIFGGLVLSFFITTSSSSPGVTDFPVAAIWLIGFLPYIIICGVAIAGGVFALRRELWGLVLAGSICAVLTTWAWPLGVAAIVFTALSKKEFEQKTTPPPF